MFKIIQNHEAAQAFPKCQFFSNIRISPKVTKNFWAEMKKKKLSTTFTISLGRLKFHKTCPKIQNIFFWGGGGGGGHFWKKIIPKMF
jgi:hypothetical protein